MNQKVLEVLVSSSVLILALALLRMLLRGKISPRLQYALWLLAALRLLIPFSVGTSTASVMNYVPERQMSEVLEDASIPAQIPRSVSAPTRRTPSAIADESSAVQTPDTAGQYAALSGSEKETVRFKPAPFTIFYFVWGIGAAIALTVMLGQNAVLAAKLRRNRERLEVPASQIPIYITNILPSACLFGLFRPAIYLMPQALDEDGTPNRYVLLHELTHYKRHDQIWCALRLFLLTVYWFDPFVWLAAHLSKLDCELACDEAALRGLDDMARITYGKTLLDQISGKRGAWQAVCATTMASSKRTLRTRICLIVKKPRMTAVTLALVVGVCCLLAACTFTNSAQKQEPTSGGDLPAMVRVDGVLYQLDMDSVSEADSARVEVMGKIRSRVSYSEVPSEDDQANYPGVGREYGMLDGQLVVKNSKGDWSYTLVNFSNDDVEAAVLRYMAPGWADICTYQRCRLGMLVAAKRTNEDASLDAILMLAQKVDGEIKITQMETGRVDDTAGYGVFQTQMAGQTIVFGIADRRMRETGASDMTSVSFTGVTLHYTEGSASTALSAEPGETFVTGVYGEAEITSVRLTLGRSGDVAVFTDIPAPSETRQAVMTLGENWSDTPVEQSVESLLSEEEVQAIRQAVFDKFSTAQWDQENLTEDEVRSFSGADSYENGMVGNYPNYYGAFADFFVAAGKAPGENQMWKLSLPDEQILALTIEEGGETLQRLYYSRSKGTLCGMRQEPLLQADTPVGVGVVTDYADENIVVFHGHFGLFVYNLQRSEIQLALDLGTATGTTNIQGSYGNFVSVYQEPGNVLVMLTGYNDMQGGDSPYSYYLNATGRVRFAPTLLAAQKQQPAHAVTMAGNTVSDLAYSDGTKTWKLFENWHFGEQGSAIFVPLTNDVAGELTGASAAEQDISAEDFYEMFWEIDRDSMQAYLDKHPQALADGWAGININASGFDQSGTTICTTMGEQVLALNFREKVLLLRVEGETYRGVLAVAKVPARLSIEMSEGIGSYGQLAGEIAEAHGGLLAMTCNGFIDPGGQGNGGELAGFAMSDGVAYGTHYPYSDAWPYARFEILTDNTVCIQRASDPVRADCRDATEFNPALIIDGEIIPSDYWTSEAPRACIGQSDRQEMLLLVIEGRMPEEDILGTSVNECAAILARHGAVQAMNVDGGTSAILWYDGQYVTRCSNPAIRYSGGRALPNAFVYHKRTD